MGATHLDNPASLPAGFTPGVGRTRSLRPAGWCSSVDTMPPSMKLTKPSAPQYSMSGRMKDPSERRDIGVGPGKYVLKDGVGSKSSISHRKTAQSFKFRKGDRFQGGMFQTEYSPGPGSYHLPRGIGSQSDSKLRSARRHCLGRQGKVWVARKFIRKPRPWPRRRWRACQTRIAATDHAAPGSTSDFFEGEANGFWHEQ